MLEYLMRFTNRKTNSVLYSRHEKPDFVYGMTDAEINKVYIVEKITDPEEIKKNTWG